MLPQSRGSQAHAIVEQTANGPVAAAVDQLAVDDLCSGAAASLATMSSSLLVARAQTIAALVASHDLISVAQAG